MDKKYIKWIGLLLFILLIFIPIMVHILYKIPSSSNFLEYEISAGDLLNYLGTILTFCGTILLSISILWKDLKNEKEREIEKKRLDFSIPEKEKMSVFIREDQNKYKIDFRFHALCKTDDIPNFCKIQCLSFYFPEHEIAFDLIDNDYIEFSEVSVGLRLTSTKEVLISAHHIVVTKDFVRALYREKIDKTMNKDISKTILIMMKINNISFPEKINSEVVFHLFTVKKNENRKKGRIDFVIQDSIINSKKPRRL